MFLVHYLRLCVIIESRTTMPTFQILHSVTAISSRHLDTAPGVALSHGIQTVQPLEDFVSLNQVDSSAFISISCLALVISCAMSLVEKLIKEWQNANHNHPWLFLKGRTRKNITQKFPMQVVRYLLQSNCILSQGHSAAFVFFLGNLAEEHGVCNQSVLTEPYPIVPVCSLLLLFGFPHTGLQVLAAE